jgi:hypothetical protein
MKKFKDIHFEVSERKILLRIFDVISVLLSLYLVGVLFKFNYVKGEPAFARDILHNGIACISINTKSGEVVNYKFLIEKKDQLADLKAILSRWYKSGIKVQERFANHEVKCILLNIQPSYAQIQALKVELGVDSFE